jgi:hypothetical protein
MWILHQPKNKVLRQIPDFVSTLKTRSLTIGACQAAPGCQFEMQAVTKPVVIHILLFDSNHLM